MDAPRFPAAFTDLLSTASSKAIIAAWILRVAEESDIETSTSSATGVADATFTDDESSPWYASLSEGESDIEIHYSVALSSGSDGPDVCLSEDGQSEDEGSRSSEVPPTMPGFPPVSELHHSLPDTAPGAARASAAPYLACKEQPFVVAAGDVHALHVKPSRSGDQVRDTFGAWKTYTFVKKIVIRKTEKEGSTSNLLGSGSDESAQGSSGRESYVSEEIGITLEEEALYYSSESEDDDDRSKMNMAREVEQESEDKTDGSEADRSAPQYYVSKDEDGYSEEIAAKEDDDERDYDADERDYDADDEDGELTTCLVAPMPDLAVAGEQGERSSGTMTPQTEPETETGGPAFPMTSRIPYLGRPWEL
ncbi:hypothetical protein EWM64_g9470 [Hericium alpestre]|uniref:Uncharacterized protein n=1 Tax=Hericium alpestre TaxID=135208 RepID=A0A4Y9ZIP6_9AGAM|nr:hypothetical protein EWM64_g9470 [Hericium alpestre]